MANPGSMTRRDVLQAAGVTLAAAKAGPASAQPAGRAVTRGRIRQSVSRWCYSKIPLPEFCRAVAAMGLTAIDLLEEADWQVVRDHGLICSMGYGGGGSIRDGLNNPANHDRIVNNLIAAMPKAVALGVPNLITFFGNRQGRGDREAIDNCVTALNRLKGPAEQHGVTICVELLNSKVDHADYHGDQNTVRRRDRGGRQLTARQAALRHLPHADHGGRCDPHDSRPSRHIAHYHTGGVPGRHELDDTQELQWAVVCRAIADTGFKGFLAHEFVPTRDPLTSLREAVTLCDV